MQYFFSIRACGASVLRLKEQRRPRLVLSTEAGVLNRLGCCWFGFSAIHRLSIRSAFFGVLLACRETLLFFEGYSGSNKMLLVSMFAETTLAMRQDDRL